MNLSLRRHHLFFKVVLYIICSYDLPKLSAITTGNRSFYSLPIFELSSMCDYDLVHLIFHCLCLLRLVIKHLIKWLQCSYQVIIVEYIKTDLPLLNSFEGDDSFSLLRHLILSGLIWFLCLSDLQITSFEIARHSLNSLYSLTLTSKTLFE